MSKKTPKPAMTSHVEAPAAQVEVPTATTETPVVKTIHNKKLEVLGSYSPESKISWLIDKNPRMPGRATFDRFAAYLGKDTVGEYMAAGGTKGDLLWDLRSGFLSIEGVTLGGEISTRKAPAPKAPKEPKAPRAKKEKVVKEKSAEEAELEALTQEETID